MRNPLNVVHRLSIKNLEYKKEKYLKGTEYIHGLSKNIP